MGQPASEGLDFCEEQDEKGELLLDALVETGVVREAHAKLFDVLEVLSV